MVLFYFNLVNYPIPGVPGICSSFLPLPGVLLIPVIKLSACIAAEAWKELSEVLHLFRLSSDLLSFQIKLLVLPGSPAGWQTRAAFLLCPQMMAPG